MPAFRVPNMRALAGVILDESRRGVRDSLAIVNQEVNARYRAGTGAPGVATLSARSRRLSGQPGPQIEMREDGLRVSGRVYMPPEAPGYASVHEYGKTIRAKTGKFLAIPLAAARTKSAAGGFSKGPRQFLGGFFMRPDKMGPLFYVRPRGSRGKYGLDFLFVLVKQVVIPPRPIWKVSELRTRRPVRDRLALIPRRVVERWAAI